MRLAEYLDKLSWSQADLAREAGVSVSSVARALKGDPVARRNANAIVKALGNGTHKQVTLAEVKGLHITELKRKKPRAAKEHDQGSQGNEESQ